MTIARLRVSMSGAGVVGPGLMTFYSRNLTPTLASSVKTFLTALAPAIAGSTVFDIPDNGDTLDEANGQLMGAWSEAGAGGQVLGAAGTFTLGQGALIQWRTSTVVFGMHPKGHTFLVPLLSNSFGSDGRLTGANVTGFQNAANALITNNGGDLVVWTRPRKANSGKFGNLPARAGAATPISSATVPTTPTALRSRRT